MATGITITRPGVAVTGSNDQEDLILDTRYPVLKVKSEGEGTLTLGIGVGSGTATISHNLGYRPQTWVYIDGRTGVGTPDTTKRIRSNNLGFADARYGTANTEIVVNDSGTASSRSWGYHYYIFYDAVEV